MRLKQAVVYAEPFDACPRGPDFVRTVISDPSELELTPDATEASEAASANLDSTSVFEKIQVLELTLTPVMKENLQSRPSSHWGINE